MSHKYTFSYEDTFEDNSQTSLSMKFPDDVSPEEVLETFITFLNINYGWDVRSRLADHLL
jgi:hypothetical protein